MHWLDFDGDTCAIIPNDTQHGKLVVDGIRNIPFDIWEKGLSALKKEFNFENLVKHLAKGAVIDRTGVITNHASKALDISNHLDSVAFHAEKLKCETVTLLSPEVFGSQYGQYGSTYRPRTDIVDGKLSLVMKGFVEARYNPMTKQIEFMYPGHVGTKTIEEIRELSQEYLGLVEILRILQGREIDGAKTGIYAEGANPDVNEFTDAVKVNMTPHQMIVRQDVLGRDVAASSRLNEFVSLSPLALIHDYTCSLESSVMDYLANGTNKIFLIQSLLTEEEAAQLHLPLKMTNGESKTIVEVMAGRKKLYNTVVHEIIEGLKDDKDDSIMTMTVAKELEIEQLVQLSTITGFSMEVIAAAAYIATYTKDTHQGEGLTYAWLLFGELLSVFSRGNKSYELRKLPLFVEEAHILNGALYVNGHKNVNVDAADCDHVAIQIINNKPYALIQKNVDIIASQRKVNYNPDMLYTIGTSGFKFHITGDEPKETWKKLIASNGFKFDIVMDSSSRVVLSIDGKSVSALMPVGAEYVLLNKRVEIMNNKHTNPINETNGAITNLVVKIVGELA